MTQSNLRTLLVNLEQRSRESEKAWRAASETPPCRAQTQNAANWIKGFADEIAMLIKRYDEVEAPRHEDKEEDAGLLGTADKGKSNGPPSTSWQPIDTAPKDEDMIIVVLNEQGPALASFSEWDFTLEQLAKCYPGTPQRFAGWVNDYGGAVLEPQPTHWMPLRAAPRREHQP